MNAATLENPLARDLDEILEQTPDVWREFCDSTVFVTGGTGFFGSWVLESFLWANQRHRLGARVVVLTRDIARFQRTAPHLAAKVEAVAGDVQTFSHPSIRCSHVIHAAGETRADRIAEDPQGAIAESLAGTRHILDWARRSGARNVLLTSSGAVYPTTSNVSEEEYPSPEAAPSAYGEAKRQNEAACLEWSSRHGIDLKIARCFSFIGPYLQMDRSFAASNFVRDAIAGRPVVAHRNRPSYRSYMYAGEMAGWLWSIFAKGKSGRPYNVGSSRRLSTIELAEAIAKAAGVGVELRVEEEGASSLAANEYVPNTDRARNELGLEETVDLPETIRRTLSWYQTCPREQGS